MSTHYHMYCDEAGIFEQLKKTHRGSILFALLVPHKQKDELAGKYRQLLKKYNINHKFIHGKDLHENEWYNDYIKDLVDLTLNSPIECLRMTYDSDFFRESTAHVLDEGVFCNRYLCMMQSFIEEVLYLNPDDYGEKVLYSFHPNSRVIPITEDKINQIEGLGFDVDKPKKESEKKGWAWRAKVWNASGLRVFLNRLQMDYGVFQEAIGARVIKQVEMPVAKKSNDPFVHWVDNLAGLVMWQNNELKRHIVKELVIDTVYSYETQEYKKLCDMFLKGNTQGFITTYLDTLEIIKNNNYKRWLSMLLERCISNMGETSIDSLIHLERQIDHLIQSSSGYWTSVSALVTFLLNAIDAMPDHEKNKPEIKQLTFRLLNHQLSCLNHRGDVAGAWETVKRADALELKVKSVSDWHARVEFVNLQAVASANLFAFNRYKDQLSGFIKGLEDSRACIAKCEDIAVNDPLIGKVSGTLAQNYAFMAPSSPDYFKIAEGMFLKAKGEFDNSADILRQNIYLAHLYIDWDQKEKVESIMAEIIKNPQVGIFWGNPGEENSMYMAYALSIILKCHVYLNHDPEYALICFKIRNMKLWFKEAWQEHPFGLICQYLGQLAFNNNDSASANQYFKESVSIPINSGDETHPTILALHAQTYVTWAKKLTENNRMSEAKEKISNALDLMHRIGRDDMLSPILELNGDTATGGWFREGYNRLKNSWDGERLNIDACDAFLRCFTFNYK